MALTILIGCDEKVREEPLDIPPESLLELATTEGLTSFIELLEETGLAESLESGTTQLTIFAPNNAAVSALPASVRDDPDMLREYLQFLVVGGRRNSALIATSDSLRSALDTFIGVETAGSMITLVGDDGSRARVVKPDLRAFNGILHVVDSFLVPTPPPGPGTVVEVATEAGLTTFVEAVETAGLVETLTDPEATFTILAPSETAFEDFGDLPANPDVLANILLTHVIVGPVPTASIATGAMLTTAAKTTVTLPADPLGDAVDLAVANGVLHEITAVLTPPTTLEVLADHEETTRLSAIITAAPAQVRAVLDPDTLAGDPPVTIFAPVDSALTGTTTPSISVLQHHVVMGQATTSSLTADATLTTLNGTLTVNVDASGNISITDGSGATANVVETDIRTLSGVIHLIDRVLMP